MCNLIIIIGIMDNEQQNIQSSVFPESDQAANCIDSPSIPEPIVESKKQNKWVEQQNTFFGINKSLYINPPTRDVQQPKTGTDKVLLPNNPRFQNIKEYDAPTYQPIPFILEESLKRQIQRIVFFETLMNKIVYDVTLDPPPQSKDLNPKDYGVDVLPYYVPTSKADTTLVFESRFQSGNLRRAIQLLEYQYQLILKSDWNTIGHTQWFYFSVSNVKKNVDYRFNMINMTKQDSLYNVGMRPLMYSERQAKMKKIGWHRAGTEVCYYQNNLKRKNGGFYYSLTFSVRFPYDCDTVYIAHCYPYTYTQLQQYLLKLQMDNSLKNRFQRKTMCQTIAGNNCDYIIIADFTNGKQKKGIFLTSRVHPGQTMASYLIEYIIDFLLGNSPVARHLRQNFIIKIVPMLNIDGVINGNYRCNLAACDLNRTWIDPNKKLHPTIFATKQLIKRMKQERDLVLVCDFHGHSRKKNIFIYGCAKDNSKKQQIFSGLMRNNCSVFKFKDCSFVLQKDREGTARIALWKQLNIVNCFTLELSFCGADFGPYDFKHFLMHTYREIADSFCQSIFDYCDPDQSKVRSVIEDLEHNGLKLEKTGNDKCCNSDGDDSDYSNDEPEEKKERVNVVQREDPLKNQILMKKKLNYSLPSKKKK